MIDSTGELPVCGRVRPVACIHAGTAERSHTGTSEVDKISSVQRKEDGRRISLYEKFIAHLLSAFLLLLSPLSEDGLSPLLLFLAIARAVKGIGGMSGDF